MTFKGSIKKGDVPETLEEVDQEIAKMQKRATRKQPLETKRERPATLTVVRKNETGQVVSDPAEAAANSDDYQGEEVVTPKTKKTPKPKAEKPVKTPKVKVEKAPKKQFNYEGLNPHGYAKVTPDVVIKAFELKFNGAKNQEIAATLNISMSSVSTIFAAPQWFREAQAKKAVRLGISFTYPEKAAKVVEKKPVEKPATKKAPKGK